MSNVKMKARIYAFVSKIPKGNVVTYGHIAKVLKLKSPRVVGWALHQNTDSVGVPCHRVVFADGSLSSSYAFGGYTAQKKRLESEGIVFSGNKIRL